MLNEESNNLSFSARVKQELLRTLPESRHCQIAELAALVSFLGEIKGQCREELFYFETENDDVLEKCFTLLQKTISIRRYGTSRVLGHEDTYALMSLLKVDSDMRLGITDGRILQQTCCKWSFLRGAFLAAGSVSDPKKSYHLEIICRSAQLADQLVSIIRGLFVGAKTAMRKGTSVVYLKEGQQIEEFLGYMGASTAYLELENVRILKDMRNSVNRKVNCETANISKTVNAAVQQLANIRLIESTAGIHSLPENLQEAAYLRLENPELSLEGLGKLCQPPVGKSGINHRLRRIGQIAEEIRVKGRQQVL